MIYETKRVQYGEGRVYVLYEASAEDLRELSQHPDWEYVADYQLQRTRYPWERGRVVKGNEEHIYCWAERERVIV